MKIRNVKKISDSEYICEIEHPVHGWIPYTSVEDSEESLASKVWNVVSKLKNVEYDIDVLKSRFGLHYMSKIESKLSQLRNGYTQEEIELWESKLIEANTVVNGGVSGILGFEAQLEGEDILVLANKIIQKNEAYKKEVLTATHLKKLLHSDVQTIQTVSDLNRLEQKYDSLTETPS